MAATIETTFQRSLKPKKIEEAVDYYFYRRLAYLLVPTLVRLGISPNTVTTISLFVGLLASYAVYHAYYTAGAMLVILAIIFDCCDGQVARLTGKSSPLGRAMDGFFDMLWVSALWLAIHFGGALAHWGLGGWTLNLMEVAALSMILHCWNFDGVKIRYLEIANPEFGEKDLDVAEAMTLAKSELKAWRLPSAFLALVMAIQMYLFVRGSAKREKKVYSFNQQVHAQHKLAPIIEKYTWLGEGIHNTIVIIGVLLLPLSPWPLVAGFVLIAGPMNLFWFSLIYQWRREYDHNGKLGA